MYTKKHKLASCPYRICDSISMFVISEHKDLNASLPLETVRGPLQEPERRPILHLLRACVRMQVSNPLGNLFQITMQDSQDLRTITHILLFCTARNVQARRNHGVMSKLHGYLFFRQQRLRNSCRKLFHAYGCIRRMVQFNMDSTGDIPSRIL